MAIRAVIQIMHGRHKVPRTKPVSSPQQFRDGIAIPQDPLNGQPLAYTLKASGTIEKSRTKSFLAHSLKTIKSGLLLLSIYFKLATYIAM